MKPVYIHGAGNISPQPTWDTDGIDTPISYQGNRLTCMEPNYSSWLDVKQMRRMSRIMKMGAAAAMLALKNASVKIPDAIISGTGLGCLDDTGIFLDKVNTLKEEALNPTPFIQSTHNTIGSHVAFLLQCQAYNQTYSHGPFSFESALLDSMLQLSDKPQWKILTGSADEVTDTSHAIQRRFGIFKRENENSLNIFNTKSKGTLHGEGSSWFVLSGEATSEKIKIEGVRTIYNPSDPIENHIQDFILQYDLKPEKIDLVLLGKSGDKRMDEGIDNSIKPLFGSSAVGAFKHLCGEYHTASSFALWLAYSILKKGLAPGFVVEGHRPTPIKNILIYNRYFRKHHSLILLSKDDV